MAGITDKEYAEYMLANYILGYVDTAIFIGANLFDKYFQAEVSSKEINRIKSQHGKKHLDLWVYIDLYINSDKIRQDVLYNQTNDLKAKLDDFRKLRNDFIHEMNDNQIIQREKEISEFILYVYFSFRKDLDYNSGIINDESINNTLLWDYRIREITERMSARMEKGKINTNSNNVKNFKGINKSDFNNLFELRKKLRYLQRNIESEMLAVNLVPTILSPIDTTSAYIWMPFVDEKFIRSSDDILETERNNLIMGSTSILATPLDFRIYIDFGGGDIDFRLSYQKFLLSEMFSKYIERFKDIEIPLKVFTTRWYSFIVDEPKNILEVVHQPDFKKQVENALMFLNDAESKKNIITSGRNLLGFILPSSEDIPKELILKLFREISHLYYEFLIFKFSDRESELRKKQQLLTETKKNKIAAKQGKKSSMDLFDMYDAEDSYASDNNLMNQISFK